MKNGTESLTRRDALRAGGAGLAAAYAGAAGAPAAAAPGTVAVTQGRQTGSLRKAPNIIVLMTDQERHVMHWPPGWADQHLPSLRRIHRHGLSFERAYTAACQCSPSRAVMMSSRFAPVNRVTQTFIWPGLQHKNRLPNVASLLHEKAGYDVVWKGKWHLSFAANAAAGNAGEDWTPYDVQAMRDRYGWEGWNPPDAGDAITAVEKNEFGSYSGVSTLGGAKPNNDGRYVLGANPPAPGQTPGVAGTTSVVDFLRSRRGKRDQPFCLFISLVNPHDIGAFPNWYGQAGYDPASFAGMGISLPPNYADDLSTKPQIQQAARAAYDKAAPLDTPEKRLQYVNFYAYLHTVVDKHITTILDTLEETGLTDDTVLIRYADHGEGGLSHGMREKAYTVYEEMIHIPFIVHNPKLYPEPRTTNAFYDHLDLLPTILDIAGVADPNTYGLGKSVVPVMRNPAAAIADHTMFSYDDLFFLPASAPGGHIRAVRTDDFTYAVYFGLDGSGLEYELYDNKNDPGQLTNLVHGEPAADVKKEWARLHALLTAQFVDAGHLPDAFIWPLAPVPA